MLPLLHYIISPLHTNHIPHTSQIQNNLPWQLLHIPPCLKRIHSGGSIWLWGYLDSTRIATHQHHVCSRRRQIRRMLAATKFFQKTPFMILLSMPFGRGGRHQNRVRGQGCFDLWAVTGVVARLITHEAFPSFVALLGIALGTAIKVPQLLDLSHLLFGLVLQGERLMLSVQNIHGCPFQLLTTFIARSFFWQAFKGGTCSCLHIRHLSQKGRLVFLVAKAHHPSLHQMLFPLIAAHLCLCLADGKALLALQFRGEFHHSPCDRHLILLHRMRFDHGFVPPGKASMV